MSNTIKPSPAMAAVAGAVTKDGSAARWKMPAEGTHDDLAAAMRSAERLGCDELRVTRSWCDSEARFVLEGEAPYLSWQPSEGCLGLGEPRTAAEREQYEEAEGCMPFGWGTHWRSTAEGACEQANRREARFQSVSGDAAEVEAALRAAELAGYRSMRVMYPSGTAVFTLAGDEVPRWREKGLLGTPLGKEACRLANARRAP